MLLNILIALLSPCQEKLPRERAGKAQYLQVLGCFQLTWGQSEVYVAVNNTVNAPYRFTGFYILEAMVVSTELKALNITS